MSEAFSIFFLILCTGFLLGWLMARIYFSPVRQTMSRIREILSSGNSRLRIPLKSRRPDVQECVGLVNQMLERNSYLAQQLASTFDNVAHDLRTPVTRLRTAAEVALQDSRDLDACREALADCLEESERVLQILNTLMDVAEAETGSVRLKIKDESIFEILEEVIDMYAEVAEEKEVKVSNMVPRSICCPLDRIRIQQAFANLLDNAIKYNQKGGWVKFHAEDKGGEIVVSVSDSGSGIATGELEKIWERLYRSDRSRTERGLGLGLSFVKAIVEAHKGTVWAESCLGEGSTFYVKLPA